MDAKYTPFDKNTESPEMKADVYQNNTRLRLHRKNQPKIFLETKINHELLFHLGIGIRDRVRGIPQSRSR